LPVILIRPRAKGDLAEIWEYISEDSEARADTFLDEIDRKFQALATSPLMGRPREELAEELRSLPVGRHIIFYRPAFDGVEIVRILHGARDIGNLFQIEE
jgi:toxin ParE1/3/4